LKKLSLSEEDFRTTAETEAMNLWELRKLDHPHLIKAIAYFTLGKKHFFMFPWVNFGSLREYCSQDPPPLCSTYLEWIFNQLCGLSEGINKLHHAARCTESWRHGDLKPDNILCFGDSYDSQDRAYGPCTFVITDVGLTKKHNTVTEERKNATRTRNGTIMYEPTEAGLDEQITNKGRSRRYDIWSMGCIYVELIIWLLYGADELNRFRNEIDGNRRFYVLTQITDSTHQGAELHNMVQKLIDWIRNDPRCSEKSAIRQLLGLVVSKLLVPENNTLCELHRKDSVVLEAKPGASSDEPPVSPAIIRTSASYFDPSDDQRSKRRIFANEMEDEMKAILNDSTPTKPGSSSIK
jgi:serine/threonine protein kinase